MLVVVLVQIRQAPIQRARGTRFYPVQLLLLVQLGVRVWWVIRVLVVEKFSTLHLPPLLRRVLLVEPHASIWKLRRLVGSKLRHLLDKLTVRLLAQAPKTRSVRGQAIQQQELGQRQRQ